MDMFNVKYNFSSSERSSMIDSAVKSLDSDLEIVSSDGAILRANFYLISMASPLLKSLFPTDKSVPARIHLPDVSRVVISHLINIVKHGFTAGQGPVDSIEREIQEAATLLGFTKVPVLTNDDGREEEEMSSSSQTFDEVDVEITEETQKEYNGETQNSLRDVNDSGKSYENDIEMVATLKKIEEIKLKVVSWQKNQEKKVKEGKEEGMKLLEALDGVKKYQQHRNIRKYLVPRIESVLDIDDAFIQLTSNAGIIRLTSKAGIVPTENSLRDVNENMANSCCNDDIDVNKQAMNQNDELVEVTDTIEGKKKPENDDISWKSKKLNIDDDLMINSEDGNEQGEVDSQDNMEQDLVISLDTLIGIEKRKCNVLLDKKWITPGKDNLLILAKNLKRSKNPMNIYQNIEPPMFSAGKRRRVLSKPEETEIEMKDKFHNNSEVKEAIPIPVPWPSFSAHPPAMECAECGKTFSSRTSLADHKAMHEGRTTCPVCQTQASTVANLRRHMKTKHGAD